MNPFKNIFIALLIVGMTSCATGQRTTIIAPSQGVVVTKVSNPRVVVHRNTNYYFSKGVWYTRNNRGYVVVNPPEGIVVKSLPRGYRVKTIRGVRYFHHNGIYYKKHGRKYTVVRI